MDTRRRISFNVNTGDTSGSIDTSNYMTIVALEDGLTASLTTNACQYCIDGDGNWIDLPAVATTQSINSGHTLSFKGNLTPVSPTGIGTFTISKKCNLEGNCTSLLFGDDAESDSLSGKNYAFCRLFWGCTTIIQVSESFLPATTLNDYCYHSMFYGCTSLTTAPELPATTIAASCYHSMFYGCTSLTTAPSILPATTLGYMCYSDMFYGCTSLTTAPELPATTLAGYCYRSMFYNCTSLTTAPELHATKLASCCYRYMFNGCRKLNYIKMLATDISTSYCLSAWVSGVSSTGTFVKHPNMTSLPSGNSGIPSGWTVYNDGEAPGGNLITFTIDETEYQAEEGMTWGEWVDSEYNTANYMFAQGNIWASASIIVRNIAPSDIILNNGVYELWSMN